MCAAWLCPEEFTQEHAYDLRQEAASGRFASTVQEFRRAVVLDPASAYRWADLGETIDGHQLATAKSCFTRALAAAPYSPAILFRAANFYFSIGDYSSSMQYLSRVVRNPELSSYYVPAFLTYERMGIPITDVLNKGIPPTRQVAQSFLHFLMDGRQVTEAEVTWKWMSNLSLADDEIAGEYVAFLIHNQQEERAAATWEQLNSAAMPDYRHSNWIFNGRFESVPKPSPFDWQIEPIEDVQASRVDDCGHDNRWSLQLIFAGKSNVDYHHVFQQTAVPAGKWRISAFLKLDGITTDQGISLRVVDPNEPHGLDIRTDPLNGTHDWTKVERVFEVDRTRLLQVEIIRRPSSKFDNKIEGKAWVDSVELSPNL